jgi:hypothetical protein
MSQTVLVTGASSGSVSRWRIFFICADLLCSVRYRVGAAARWLPRVRSATPWTLFASGVRRRFALDAIG